MAKNNEATIDTVDNEASPMCGLVMPISDGNGYTADHWQQVREIIEECLTELNFKSRIVSEGQEIGIIQGRIVDNLYNDPLVICDVSSRNPNVMFELGMRITFDKPVIIIKDDEVNKIFDTDIIEFVPYKRNLNYKSVQKFKLELKDKITATYQAGKQGNYSVFLKHFKNIKATKLDEKEVGLEDLMNQRFDELYNAFASFTRNVKPPKESSVPIGSVKRNSFYLPNANNISHDLINGVMLKMAYTDYTIETMTINNVKVHRVILGDDEIIDKNLIENTFAKAGLKIMWFLTKGHFKISD